MSQHGCPERLSNRSKGFQEDGPSQQTMEVLVETLTGTAFEMTVSPSDTIFAIKSKIFRVEGIPVSQQHLVYNLQELEDASSLQEVGIADGARLRLVLGMRGGPISTRRLPPPPAPEPWRDIETLLDSNREDGEWASGGGGGGGGGSGSSGWKVTVLVFRDGDRVNMVRVRENHDGTYSPLALALDHNKSSSSSSLSTLGAGAEQGSGRGGGGSGTGVVTGAVHENAVTMGKMVALRRRMEDLSVLRRRQDNNNDKADIQKTRSEETLSVPSLLDEPVDAFKHRTYTPYAEEDSFSPLYDGNYTRYDYDCSFADRYTLLPPIGTRTDSDQSVQEAVADSERLNVAEGVSGLVEPVVGVEVGVGVEVAPTPEPRRPARARAPLPAADYGPVVCGSVGVGNGVGVGVGVGAWGGLGLGLGLGGAVSASSLHAHTHAHGHGSTRPTPPRAHRPKLSDALFSSSTSDLDNLKRNSRILPALSRHRNRSHLHLSDEGLHLHNPPDPPSPPTPPTPPADTPAPAPAPAPPARAGHAGDGIATPVATQERKVRVRCGLCRKRLSIATVHRCRCGAVFCAPHRYAEVHGCLYDYKQPTTHTHTHQYLLVQAPKLPKI